MTSDDNGSGGWEQDPVAAHWEKLRKLSRPSGSAHTGSAKDKSTSDGLSPAPVTQRQPFNPRRRRRGSKPQRMKTRYDGRLDRSYRDPGQFGDLVHREISRNGWNRNFAVSALKGNWASIVGENMAQHTTVVMYKEKERQLHIECDSTAWATNLRLMQTMILQTIAKKIGGDVVAELRIYGPRPPSWRKGRYHVPGRGPRDTYG